MIGPGRSGGMTEEQEAELEELTEKKHEHSNLTVIEAITANMKTALVNLNNHVIASYLAINTYLTVGTDATIDGYTKLGEDATAIKTTQITGDTPGLGFTGSYATGVAAANIVSFSIVVWDSDGAVRPPFYGEYGSFSQYYLAYIGSNGVLYIEIPTVATDVYNCGFSCLITYSE